MKLSTTVAAENFTFLETMVSTGRTDSIAEAVDLAIARLRRVENRDRLGAATASVLRRLVPRGAGGRADAGSPAQFERRKRGLRP
jgi:hypothetical protein